MAKDGREMQWRQIAEHETPELVSLPDHLDERYALEEAIRFVGNDVIPHVGQ